MAVEKIVTLCKEGDSTIEYYPNVKGDNIPSGAVAKGKLTQALQDEIDGKAPQSTTYTKTEIDNKLSGKVNVATYNAKVSELETAIGTKANASDVYTKTATDDLLDAKANADDVYTKSQVYTKTETDTLLSAKANSSDVYTKTETNTLLDGKQATLVSGTNIKTINNQSLLGSGDITISGGSQLYAHLIHIDIVDVSEGKHYISGAFTIINTSPNNLVNNGLVSGTTAVDTIESILGTNKSYQFSGTIYESFNYQEDLVGYIIKNFIRNNNKILSVITRYDDGCYENDYQSLYTSVATETYEMTLAEYIQAI